MTIIPIDRSTVRRRKPAPQFIPGLINRTVDGLECSSIDVHQLPQSRFTFDYLPTPVTCDSCGAKFPHTELREEDGGPELVTDVCPKCGEPFCCELEYERLSQAELEKLSVGSPV